MLLLFNGIYSVKFIPTLVSLSTHNRNMATVTIEQLSKHNTVDSLWIAIHGNGKNAAFLFPYFHILILISVQSHDFRSGSSGRA